ncbi:MAG: S41 family peptidase, partial [Candidatus Sericytochromatia bacterium]|nr:S41 family peptidase [Candidatus Sericytochromatia bacterium]
MASFSAGMGLYSFAGRAESANFGIFIHVYDLLKSEYVDKTVDDTKLLQGAIRGMLESIGDPYTRYMDPQAFRGMQEERQGSFSGIGIQLGMKGDQLTVIAPLDDTPAAKAGLLAGDKIMAIDTKVTKGLAVEEAVNLIRGKSGTTVILKMQRGEKVRDVPIVRGSIETKTVRARMIDKSVGYIRLASFMSNEATNEMKKAVEDLKGKGLKALVLDLRMNPGGLLPNAVDIGSMFIEKGAVVQIVDRNGVKQTQDVSGHPMLKNDIPMVVLIDGGSASASEILAGALKDQKRATLMGTRSFGKGLVQTVHPLQDGSGVAITTNKYLTPNGTDINHKGIEPDVLVELPKPKEGQVYTPETDPQLLRAVSLLKDRLAHKEPKRDSGGEIKRGCAPGGVWGGRP